MDINDDTPVVTRDEILISAPIQSIWDLQTNVDGWPVWQPDVDGGAARVRLGVQLAYRRPGHHVDRRGGRRPSSDRVGGAAQGIVAVHVWPLDERDGGVVVHTEESWEGDPVAAQTEALQEALDGSLRAWLENLKREAERSRPS